MHRKTIPLLIVVGLGIASIGFADPTGLWQFNGGMTAQIGTDLTLAGGSSAAAKVAFGTCSQFGAPLINGNNSQIMRFTRFAPGSEGIQVYGDLPANGGGAYCNRWTIAMDFCTTSNLSDAFDPSDPYYSCPFDTNPALNDDQGEMYFSYNSGTGNMSIGAGGRLGGYYPIPTVILQWHRIVFTVDQSVGNVKVYFDGSLVGTYAQNAILGGPDGKYSLYTGNVVSLILFGAAGSYDTGGGYLNSLAIYDHVLTPDQVAALGGPSDGGLPATEPAVGSLVRHSEFVGYDNTGNNPMNGGDVSYAWAVDGLWSGGIYGYYQYTSDYNGSLILHHPNHNWDDPVIDIYTTPSLDVFNPIPTTNSLEVQAEYYPQFNDTGFNEFIELSITDPGLGHPGDPEPAEFQTRLTNLGDGSLAIECNAGTSMGAYRVLGQTVDDLSDVRAIITYDAAATQYHAYYEFNNSGQIIEAPGSPITMARTKNDIRLECGMEYSGFSEYTYNCYVKDVKVYNAVQTTAPTGCVDGQIQRHSTFSSAAGSILTDGYWPITKPHELSGLGYATGVTFDYDGAGTFYCNHPGTIVYPNATINFNTALSESAEWKAIIRPEFTATGNGQNFNMKIDGNPVSFFLTNVLNQATLTFGGVGATLATPSDQISSMTLIINYDNATQKYGAYYQVNSDTMVPHPGTQYAQVRGTTDGTKVEFQWQAANVTDPFSVGIDDFTETCGVQTLIVPPAAVKDWQIF